MAIYESNAVGIVVETNQQNLLNESQFRGYLSQEDLVSLTSGPQGQIDNCVGIRLYNLVRGSQRSQIMAVGVLETGFELTRNYRLSKRSDANDNDAGAQAFSMRDNARNATEPLPAKADRYSVFFSRDMLNRIRNAGSQKSGVNFYEIPLKWILENLSAAELSVIPQEVKNMSAIAKTLVAVPADLNGGSTQEISTPNMVDIAVASHLPCPPYCIDNLGRQNHLPPSPSQMNEDDDDPYLIRW